MTRTSCRSTRTALRHRLTERSAQPTRPSIENRRKIPSYFHAHGNCQKGDRCDFAHGTAAAAPANGATTLSMEEQAGAQHSDSESDIDHEDDIDSDM